MVEADRRQMPELGVIVEARQVNGQPVAVFLDPDGSIVNVWSLDIADWLVQTVRSAIDPDKLRHLGPVADVRALLRAHRRRPDANT